MCVCMGVEAHIHTECLCLSVHKGESVAMHAPTCALTVVL